MGAGRAAAALTLALALSAATHAAPAQSVDDGLVYLEGGTVWIGSPQSERQRGSDEVRHQVRIGPFYIDPREVTQADYQAVTGTNPSGFRGGKLPVERVT